MTGDDKEGLLHLLSESNPRNSRRRTELAEPAKVHALLNDGKMSEEQKERLESRMNAINDDATLTAEQKQEKMKELIDVRIFASVFRLSAVVRISLVARIFLVVRISAVVCRVIC